MNRQKFVKGLIACATLTCVTMACVAMASDQALAQAAFQPLSTAATNIQTFLTGAFVTTVCIIAVIAVGLATLAGRIAWGWLLSVVIGVCLIFGAPQIISSLHQ